MLSAATAPAAPPPTITYTSEVPASSAGTLEHAEREGFSNSAGEQRARHGRATGWIGEEEDLAAFNLQIKAL